MLAKIEEAFQERNGASQSTIGDFLSIASGTSTGAIISGTVAAGVPAARLKDFYVGEGAEFFRPINFRRSWRRPLSRGFVKGDAIRKIITGVLDEVGAAETTLADLYRGPLVIIPAFELRSQRTHYFRTRALDDSKPRLNGDYPLIDAITASALSAPLIFGEVEAPNVQWIYTHPDGSRELHKGAVFNDGGQGYHNCTVELVANEALARGWARGKTSDEQVLIISLGTGNDFPARDYQKTLDLLNTRQIFDFKRGQARNESVASQIAAVQEICATNPNYHLARFDWQTDNSSNIDSFVITDNRLKEYVNAAETIISGEPFRTLLSNIRALERINHPGSL